VAIVILTAACRSTGIGERRQIMFDLAIPWWDIVLRTTVAYAALVVGFRVFGRRQLGQMTPFDLVVILLIANALQNAMVGTDASLAGGLIAAGTLLAVNRLVAVARRRLKWFERVAEGEPILLVSAGRILTDRLEREGVDIADLEQAAREHGVADLADVDAAVLEVDGTVSIIPATDTKITSRRKLRRRKAQ
jgi:uncharacterized membrane protein YcaP (DUF421 family)